MEWRVAKEEKHFLRVMAARGGRDSRKPLTPRGTRGARGVRGRACLGLLAAAVLAAACDPTPSGDPDSARAEREAALLPHWGPFSADAQPEISESLQLDLEAPRHRSDGGGTARIEAALEILPDGVRRPAHRNAEGRPVFRAGELARFELVFEAGRRGVAKGGFVFLQVSPFWEWDDPQTLYEDGPGFTRVSTQAEGVTVDATLVSSQLLAIEIGGRALAAGEQIRIVYGAGPRGARVDRYAERGATLWFAVDGDGDGIRALIADPPKVEIGPREPAHLVATLTTAAAPGDELRLNLALVDARGNAGTSSGGEVTIEVPDGLELPASAQIEPGGRGRVSVVGRALREGTFRVRAEVTIGDVTIESESNPLVARAGIPPVLWGDLHGHSQLSDGTGTPDDFYDYARNVAALDVAALTDHDHWGMRFLDANPKMWDRIRKAVARYHEPGRFVTLLGYEWTSWLQGHRHVLYFSDRGDVLSSLDPRYERPDQLWEALRERNALTFAHHSAGGPISTNWTFAPPPDLEPVTEVASVHGQSEAPDGPAAIYNPVPGNFVRDALQIGYRFGFIGSGDSHDGHPGLAGIATGGVSGLAAIRASAHTREAVLEALRAHRTYATSGPRIYLEAALEPGEVPSTRSLRVEVAAVAPIERVDFIRSGLVASVPGEDQRDLSIEREIPALAPGEFLYVRVVQLDGGTAWSSPIYGPLETGDESPRSAAGAH